MKLVSQSGETLFDFGRDGVAQAFLWRCMITAKFPEDYFYTEITMNSLTNGLLESLQAAKEKPSVSQKHQGVRALPDHVSRIAAEAIADQVLNLRAQWFGTSLSERRDLCKDALFPFDTSDQSIDHVMREVEKKVGPRKQEVEERLAWPDANADKFSSS
ncbi:hypothetical protein ACFELO_10005 [Oceanicaulis sp. LC35]|uniref:hypothetical protein n=1 Tax=Oceanicaulis sp. LC35 TaxID=3349635 RepID=UPI003F8551CF